MSTSRPATQKQSRFSCQRKIGSHPLPLPVVCSLEIQSLVEQHSSVQWVVWSRSLNWKFARSVDQQTPSGDYHKYRVYKISRFRLPGGICQSALFDIHLLTVKDFRSRGLHLSNTILPKRTGKMSKDPSPYRSNLYVLLQQFFQKCEGM
jgi:hypothetical protein